MEEKKKMDQVVEFGDASGFLAWLQQGGKVVKFPYGPKGWEVEIGSDKPLEIKSGFYTVSSRPPYGAPKICGILYPFDSERVCGVITIGFNAEGKPAVINRRRTTSADKLPDGQIIVGVVEPTPDRVEEPSAVCIKTDEVEKIKALSAEDWLRLYDVVRDGPELCAVLTVWRWSKTV